MRVVLIAAVAENGVIGRDGKIPWRLPADLAYFKRTTMGHTLVMGRRTFESTGVLPGRTTLILTRDPDYRPPAGPEEGRGRIEVVGSLDEALARARELGETTVFIGGGEGIYREALERADRMHLTRVAASPPGDTRFPEPDWSRWHRVSREEHPPDERNPHAYAFEVYQRIQGSADADGGADP